MRKTKLICTIGTACSDEQTLTAMLQSGMNAARFLFSKKNCQETADCIKRVRSISKRLSLPIAILLDISDSTCPTKQDHEGLYFGIEQDVDYIICQAIHSKHDLLDIRTVLEDQHADHISLLAKIETQAGVNNIDAICEVASGVMIDRTKLGEEIAFEQIPAIQKQLITKCRLLGKQVITATMMLTSMIHAQNPTSAETSDVANAIYDGTSAVMLSDETAIGDFPLAAVEAMNRIVSQTEENIHYRKRFFSSKFLVHSTIDALSHAACSMAIDLNAKAIVVCTQFGTTAAMLSRFRAPMEIAAVTDNQKTYDKLSLLWGITPVFNSNTDKTDLPTAKACAASALSLRLGDCIILTDRMTNQISYNSNLIKVEAIV